MQIYKYLGLDDLDCSVAIIKNASSNKMGKKDIIKIADNMDLNLDVLGYIDPDITVCYIRDGKIVEKKHLVLLSVAFAYIWQSPDKSYHAKTTI